MPRPTDKRQLLDLEERNHRTLLDLVDSLTPEQQRGEFPVEDRDRCVRDVLAHLHEWHLMMLRWYRDGMAGTTPAVPAPGYTWRTLPDLNREIWARYQDVDLDQVRADLETSRADVRALIEQHTDEELFVKKHYPWTGSTSLGAYLISSTTSHDDWATKKLKAYRKALAAS